MGVLKLLVLCAFAEITIGTPILDSSRIVNGTNAKEGEIPYIVSLRIFGIHGCGGSILDETHVLTASHCVDGTSSEFLSVQYGVLDIESTDNIIDVQEVYQHERYDSWNNWANDVAVLILKSPIVLGNHVKVTTLPKQGEVPPFNNPAVVSGWGLDQTGGTIQRYLKTVEILLFTDEYCRNAYGIRVNSIHHICAGVVEGGKSECNGDSGGPLTVDGIQVGIVSWSTKPCASKGNPGVYARIATYIDWINDKLKL